MSINNLTLPDLNKDISLYIKNLFLPDDGTIKIGDRIIDSGLLTWVDPVISRINTPPGSPNTGDRYLITSGATGAWLGKDDNIAEWNGSAWDFTAPTNGLSCIVLNESVLYVYDNMWISLGGGVSTHNDLSGIQGGDTNEYYHFTDDEHQLRQTIFGTGKIGTGLITTQNTTTSVDISSGNIGVWDGSKFIVVNFSAQTNVTLTNIGSWQQTYIICNSNGIITQSENPLTADQQRTQIQIAEIEHSSGTIESISIENPVLEFPHNQIRDGFNFLGIRNYKGNHITANGSNIDKSAGVIFGPDVNMDTNNPYYLNSAAQTAFTFDYISSIGTIFSSGNNQIDSDNYESSPGVISNPPGGVRWTIQRVYLSKNGTTIRIMYGQNYYNNTSTAIANQNDAHVEPDFIKDNYVNIAKIIIREGRNINHNSTIIIQLGKFGNNQTVVTLETLQDTYNVSNPANITTDGTIRSLQFQGGTGTDTDNTLEFLNNAGTSVTQVDGNGDIKFGSTNGISFTNGSVKNVGGNIVVESNAVDWVLSKGGEMLRSVGTEMRAGVDLNMNGNNIDGATTINTQANNLSVPNSSITMSTAQNLVLGTSTIHDELDDLLLTSNNIVLANNLGGSASVGINSVKTIDLGQNIDVVNGDYQIGATSVLNSTTLGTGIVNSSLTNVGTLTELQVDNINIDNSRIRCSNVGDMDIATVNGDITIQRNDTDHTTFNSSGITTEISNASGVSSVIRNTNAAGLAEMFIEAQSTGGDSQLRFGTNGDTPDYTIGLRNSDNVFVIAASSALNSDDLVEINNSNMIVNRDIKVEKNTDACFELRTTTGTSGQFKICTSSVVDDYFYIDDVSNNKRLYRNSSGVTTIGGTGSFFVNCGATNPDFSGGTECIECTTTGQVFTRNLGTSVATANPIHITAFGELFESTSSRKYKKDIDSIGLDNPLIKNFNKLNPVSFKYKKNDKELFYGLIAEELNEIDDTPIVFEKDGKDCRGIDYNELIPILIKKIQLQQKEINQLREKMLKTSYARLLRRVVDLEDKLKEKIPNRKLIM